jgi:hypothetical protein
LERQTLHLLERDLIVGNYQNRIIEASLHFVATGGEMRILAPEKSVCKC